HTRFSRDWSSEVCSSDLATVAEPDGAGRRCRGRDRPRGSDSAGVAMVVDGPAGMVGVAGLLRQAATNGPAGVARRRLVLPCPLEIGRASCREGAERALGA